MNSGHQIPIFVVNMRSQVERQKAISKHLTQLGLQFTITDGVNGKELPDDRVQELLGAGVEMPRGHVGCYLSHINIYRYMIEQNINLALVLEDDARISRQAADLLKSSYLVGADFDYCFLDSEDHDADGVVFYDRQDRISLGAGINACRLSHGPSALHAYLISLPAARKRMELAFPITRPIDTYKHLPYDIKFYAVVSPKLAWVSEYGMTSSTYERDSSVDQLSRRFLRKSFLYYRFRDFLKLKWWSGRQEVRNAVASGRLPPNGQWRRLPSGKEIVVD